MARLSYKSKVLSVIFLVLFVLTTTLKACETVRAVTFRWARSTARNFELAAWDHERTINGAEDIEGVSESNDALQYDLLKSRVSPSVCLKIPGYKVLDKVPIRSPLLVADHLIQYSRGKVIFEVGTRNGDILACVSSFSRKAISAEINEEYCHKLKGRGLDVVCEDFTKLNLTDLPEFPHIFFWWPMVADEQNERWLTHIKSQVSHAPPEDRKVIIAFDNQWPPDKSNKEYMKQKYLGEEHIVEFAESTQDRSFGTFSLLHFPLVT
jgi:hypothetical protein